MDLSLSGSRWESKDARDNGRVIEVLSADWTDNGYVHVKSTHPTTGKVRRYNMRRRTLFSRYRRLDSEKSS